MRVDVYPNITNVEVYENPISIPVEATWEKVTFTVPDPISNTFVLPSEPTTDRDGDFVLQVHYNSVVAEYGVDYTLDEKTITWISPVVLEPDEILAVWYSPKSFYGSVPMGGDVTSLTHLTDVVVEGPTVGDLLIRNDNKFVNKKLTGGTDITVTSDNTGVTIASTAQPNLPTSLLTNNVDAEVQRAYIIDSTNNASQVSLPLAPVLGDVVVVSRFGGENVTILRGAHNIDGVGSDVVLADKETAFLRYANVNIGWFRV